MCVTLPCVAWSAICMRLSGENMSAFVALMLEQAERDLYAQLIAADEISQGERRAVNAQMPPLPGIGGPYHA